MSGCKENKVKATLVEDFSHPDRYAVVIGDKEVAYMEPYGLNDGRWRYQCGAYGSGNNLSMEKAAEYMTEVVYNTLMKNWGVHVDFVVDQGLLCSLITSARRK